MSGQAGRALSRNAVPGHVLLQFRIVANAVRSLGPRSRHGQLIGDRKLLALSAIDRSPGMGVNAVASVLGVRQPTASQVVKALAALHLVDVHKNLRDRRTVQIHASAEGQALLRELPTSFTFDDPLPAAIGRLEPRSIDSLERGLAELLRALSGVRRASSGSSGGR